MDRIEIKELLKEVLGVNTEIIDQREWVSIRCPLARWTHAGGSDSSPSSGISVKDDDTSIFHCWTCGSKGTIVWLLRELEKYTGESFRKLINEIDAGEFLGGDLPEWGERKRKEVKETILDSAYLDLYDSAVGHWYLRDRGVTDAVAKDLQLLVDPDDSQGDERILFPIFTKNKELQGFTGRAVLSSVELRIRDYHGLQKANALLGLHLVDTNQPFVVLVEGLFDMAIVYQYGYSVVATLHAGVTVQQMAKLIDLGMPIVFMFDNDEAGKKATDRAIELIGDRLPMSRVSYPERRVKGKRVWVKDPATCSMEEVDNMLKNADIV